MEQPSTPSVEQTDILDVFIALAESWWLLVGLPVLFGAVAFIFAITDQQQYQAVAEVFLIRDAPTLARLPEFETALAERVPAAASAIPSLTIKNDVATKRTSGSVRLPDAQLAGLLASEALNVVRQLDTSNRKNLPDAVLEIRGAEIARLSASVELLQQWLDPQRANPASEMATPQATVDALVILNSTLAQKQADLTAYRDEKTRLEAEMIRPPSVTVTPIPRDKRPIVAAVLAGAVLAVVIVYLRYVVNLARKSPGFEQKRTRILRALPFGSAFIGTGRSNG